MNVEEAKYYLPFIIRDLEASYYNKNFINALKIIKKEIENSISTKKIEDKMKQIDYRTANGEERYYQKAILQELLEEKINGTI